MKPRISAGRPADRKNQIESYLRQQIVSGVLSPGSRLPNRSEIEQQFGTGPGTVQTALTSLARDGFILSRGSRGTFVAENPPHLTRYALVFPSHPSSRGNWVRFWAALNDEAHIIEQNGARRLRSYYNVDGHVDSEDFVQLVRDAGVHRVAGLIFTFPPTVLESTLLLKQEGIPRVVLASTPYHDVPSIGLDLRSYINRALDFLLERGRKHVAIIMSTGYGSEINIEQAIKAHGMETRPYWLQHINLGSPETARECAHLLMNCRERPDALIIADDNLVEYVTAGIVAAGVRVPDELEVVAHCNFPYPTPSILPVHRLGYNARQVLAACVDSIDRQRRGEQVSSFIQLPASFESELDY